MASSITSTIVLKVSGKEVEHSFNGLAGTVKKFERELKKLTPGTEQFIKKSAELKEARGHFEKVKNEINLLNGRLQKTEGILGRFSSRLNNFSLKASDIFAGITAGVSAKTISELLKVSDAMADVQKTTGMTLEEVKQLWDALDEADTRTGKLERLKIAEVGGRLGVPKEEMSSFVQEIDKAYVALGDSFQGGLEAVVDNLGKIKGLFKETQAKSYAQAINEVGSALNELAANGTASEGNISDFALRVGALPDAVKPSVDKVLGLGAAFEESGVNAQIAASGYSNFMKIAGENLKSFAYSMNISSDEARKLFNEKPEEFFLRFAQGMRGVPADETIKIFDSLKIGTLEVQKAVGAAANRTDEFRTAMQFSASAMEKATSLNDEFNKKNNNAAAIWDKLTNSVAEFFTKTNMINRFEGIINAVGSFTGITDQAGEGVKKFKDRLLVFSKLIILVVVSLVSYNTALTLIALTTKNATQQTILYNTITKAKILITSRARGVILLLAYAKAKLTGNTNKARNAMIAYNSVMKTNPVGLLISLLTTGAAALYLFYKNTEKVNNVSKKMKEEFINAGNAAGEEMVKLKLLYKTAIDHKQSINERKEAVRQLKEEYPSYFKHINDEIIMNGKAESSYHSLRKAIISSARAKAVEKVLQDRESERLKRDAELELKIIKEKRIRNKLKSNEHGEQTIGYDVDGKYHTVTLQNSSLLKASRERLSALKKEKDNNIQKDEKEDSFLISMMKKNLKDSEKLNNDRKTKLKNEFHNIIAPDNGTGKTTGGKSNPKPSTDAQEAKKDLEQSKDLHDKAKKQLINLEQELSEEKLKIKQNSMEQELEAQTLERNKELSAYKEHSSKILDSITELEEKIKNTKSPESREYYKKSLDAEWKALEKNNQLIEQSEQTHLKKMTEIQNKWILKNYENEVNAQFQKIESGRREREKEINDIESLEQAKALLKSKSITELYRLSQEELSGIISIEEAKKHLREAYDREALHATEMSIRQQISKISEMLKDPALSPEAINKLREDLEKADGLLQRVRGEKGAKQGEDEQRARDKRASDLSQIDILGFSAAQWEEVFNNLDTTARKLNAAKMIIQGMSNAFEHFSQLQKNLGQKEMQRFTVQQEKKKTALLKQLNQGLISQEQYHKGIQGLEEQTNEKRKQIAEQQAKAEKIAKMFSVVANTSVAIMQAYAQLGPVGGSIAAAIIGTIGAIQLAAINEQELPQYDRGGYTGKGYGHPDSSGFKPAGIVHENEYVTPKWMLENPVVADVVDWMESIRTGRTTIPKGYNHGGYTTDHPTTEKPVAENRQHHENIDDKYLQLISDVRDLLSYLKENGVEAWMAEDAENGRRIKRTIKMFERIQNKNERK